MNSAALSFKTVSPAGTRRLAKSLAHALHCGDIIGLIGDLGAGKTAFVDGLVREMHGEGVVSSPTYTLVNIYDKNTPPIYHIDLYRLQHESELEEVGYEDYLYGNGITVIEWFDKVDRSDMENYITIEFCIDGESERTININGFGSRGIEIVESLRG